MIMETIKNQLLGGKAVQNKTKTTRGVEKEEWERECC